jgi:sugar-phosphatase
MTAGDPTTFTVQAFLFDLDGTLVDSTGSVERNWRKLADRLGRPFSELAPLIHGIPVGQVMKMLDPDMPADEIASHAQFMVENESTDTEGVVAQPGAIELLRLLPADRWAVVTSGGDRLANARIAAAGLPRPPKMVTADDVAVGKPAPDPYLAGARAIGRAPGECLVVEDAPAGVESAKAAGCPVVGVLTTHPDLSGLPLGPTLADLHVEVRDDGLIVTTAGPR